MFNKPLITNRNDPVTRKDLGSTPSNIASSTSTTGSPTLSNFAGKTLPTGTGTPEATTAVADKDEGAVQDSVPVVGARLIVGPDVKLRGAEILDCDTLVVEGRVEATMDSRVIRIADQGSFSGKVSIDIAEIHGHFEGELTARSQLIIHATGRVSGKIRYGKLVIDEGGELCGDINTLSADKSSQNRPRNEPIPTLNVISA
ncbi:MAG: bactofilin family protein [Bacteroidota bacterium]